MIRLYNDKHLGYKSIFKKIMVSAKVVEIIIRKFHMHGKDALKKKKNRKFSDNTKLEIIKSVLSGEDKISVSIEHNIELYQIRLRIINHKEKGYNGPINKPAGSRLPRKKKHTVPNDKDAIIR